MEVQYLDGYVDHYRRVYHIPSIIHHLSRIQLNSSSYLDLKITELPLVIYKENVLNVSNIMFHMLRFEFFELTNGSDAWRTKESSLSAILVLSSHSSSSC